MTCKLTNKSSQRAEKFCCSHFLTAPRGKNVAQNAGRHVSLSMRGKLKTGTSENSWRGENR